MFKKGNLGLLSYCLSVSPFVSVCVISLSQCLFILFLFVALLPLLILVPLFHLP